MVSARTTTDWQGSLDDAAAAWRRRDHEEVLALTDPLLDGPLATEAHFLRCWALARARRPDEAARAWEGWSRDPRVASYSALRDRFETDPVGKLSGHALRGMHVLYVDDDECMRRAMHHLVRCAGGALTTAQTTQQGLELLGDARFDVVVSDFNRPGSNGVTFLAACRLLHPELPLMLYSAAMPLAAVRRAVCVHGVERAYWKPANVHRLVAVMSGLARARA